VAKAATGGRTIAADLERDRLQARYRRLVSVLRELQQRVDESPPNRVPVGLRHAIRDFDRQLVLVGRRLTELDDPVGPRRVERAG
jgi:hypothetical protein